MQGREKGRNHVVVGDTKRPPAGEAVLIYLASPYTHTDPAMRIERFRAACVAAARLIRAGHVVFSPIAHSHALAEHGLPIDWSFWQRQDREHVRRCEELVVLTLDGWRESVGVQAEVGLARAWGKPVRYLAPDADRLTRAPRRQRTKEPV